MAQDSNAARYLATQEIAAACETGGTFRAGGLVERDLTGDGRADLIIDHGAIACAGESARSGYCGVQVCTVNFYVRDGDLLILVTEMLAAGVAVGAGDRPAITGFAHGGAPWSIRWTGAAFE